MARIPQKRGKPISRESLEDLREKIIQGEMGFAKSIATRQSEFFRKKKQIKGWGELKIAEDIKRVILGLHTEKSAMETTGKIIVEVVNYAGKRK